MYLHYIYIYMYMCVCVCVCVCVICIGIFDNHYNPIIQVSGAISDTSMSPRSSISQPDISFRSSSSCPLHGTTRSMTTFRAAPERHDVIKVIFIIIIYNLAVKALIQFTFRSLPFPCRLTNHVQTVTGIWTRTPLPVVRRMWRIPTASVIYQRNQIATGRSLPVATTQT